MTRIATILAALVVTLAVASPAQATKRKPHRPVVIAPVVITLPDFGTVDPHVVCPRAPVAHPVCIPIVR